MRVAVAALAWLVIPATLNAQAIIRADGSSTVFPVTEAVGRAFQVARRGTVRVMVGISGTTGGFRKFCKGETDLQDASRRIQPQEIEACRASGVEYYALPVGFDGITVVVNRANTWIGSLTLLQLKKIWQPEAQGRIMRWRDVDPGWPDAPLILFAPGPDSGTFDYFTEVVVGTRRATRADYLSSEDDNAIVRGIEGNANALGYVPFSYYAARAQSLKAVMIDGGAGPVAPTLDHIADGSYAPLSRPLFLYVNAESARRPEVRQFVEFLLERGEELIREANYLPLSPASRAAALEYFRNGKPAVSDASEISFRSSRESSPAPDPRAH